MFFVLLFLGPSYAPIRRKKASRLGGQPPCGLVRLGSMPVIFDHRTLSPLCTARFPSASVVLPLMAWGGGRRALVVQGILSDPLRMPVIPSCPLFECSPPHAIVLR